MIKGEQSFITVEDHCDALGTILLTIGVVGVDKPNGKTARGSIILKRADAEELILQIQDQLAALPKE